MKKYPWDELDDVDFSMSWPEISNAFMLRYHLTKRSLIDQFFAAKLWRMACIASWLVSAVLVYCLVVVSL